MIRPRWPLWIAGGAALAWLALAGAMLAALRLPEQFPPKLVIAGGIALALAAPVAVLALVALRLVDSRRAEDARMALLADTAWTTDNRIAEADTLLASVEARVAALVGIAAAPDFTEDMIWRRLDPGQRATLREKGSLSLPSAYDPAGMLVTRRLIDLYLDHIGTVPPDVMPRPTVSVPRARASTTAFDSTVAAYWYVPGGVALVAAQT
jgi:hypothetical protein